MSFVDNISKKEIMNSTENDKNKTETDMVQIRSLKCAIDNKIDETMIFNGIHPKMRCNDYILSFLTEDLEDLSEFVFFSIITTVLQYGVLNEKENIQQINKNNFSNDKNEYYQLIENYHNLNHKKQIEFLEIQKKEKAIQKEHKVENGGKAKFGSRERYQGDKNIVYQYQKPEFDILMKIKMVNSKEMDGVDDEEIKKLKKANKTYKRIISKKGYLKLITLAEYANLIDVLRNEIDNSEDPIKNIRYYKLEYNLGFELMKAILKSIHQCKKNGKKIEDVFADLVLLYKVPLLTARQKYALLYPQLNQDQRQKWRNEVAKIPEIIRILTGECEKSIISGEFRVFDCSSTQAILDLVVNEYSQIFLDQQFKNSFCMRTDFNSDDLKEFLTKLDETNMATHKKIKKTYQ